MPWQERGTDISAWPTQKVSSSLGNKSLDRNSWNLIVMGLKYRGQEFVYTLGSGG